MGYKFKLAQLKRDFPEDYALIKQDFALEDQAFLSSLIVYLINKSMVEILDLQLDYLDGEGTASLLHMMYTLADDIAQESSLDDNTKTFFTENVIILEGE